MPMTIPGLQEIGLTDWPGWYRTLNPGYFAVKNTSRLAASGRRTRGRTCAGNGCCESSGHVVESAIGRLRGSPRVRGHGRLTREDAGIGEEILDRLRAMSREGKKAASKSTAEKEVSNNVLLERAANKETRKWEDESEDKSEVDEKSEVEEKRVKNGKEKLVDV